MNTKTTFAVLVLALVATSAVIVEGTDDNQDASHPEDNDERQLQVQAGGNEVEIESENRSGRVRDKFRLRAHFEGSSFELRMDRFAQVSDSAAGFRFRIRPHSIVEYVEVDDVAGLTAGDNTNCTKYRILGSAITASQPVVSQLDANTSLTTVTLSSANGLFQLVLKVTGSTQQPSKRAVIGGRTITPTTAKFDIILTPTAQNFAYSCPNSRLALLVKVKSKQQTRARTETGTDVQTAVQLGDAATPLGFFSWAQTVTINNTPTTASVVTSGFSTDPSTGPDAESDLDSSDGERSQRAFFSFITPRPTKITWDPEIGYQPLGSTSAAGTITASAWIFASAAMLVSLVATNL